MGYESKEVMVGVSSNLNVILPEDTRAGIGPLTDGLSKEQLRMAIEQERRVELYCEGRRWYDLARTGRLQEVMNQHFQDYAGDENEVGQNSSILDHEIIFPIPQSEVLLNPEKIRQNPGY